MEFNGFRPDSLTWTNLGNAAVGGVPRCRTLLHPISLVAQGAFASAIPGSSDPIFDSFRFPCLVIGVDCWVEAAICVGLLSVPTKRQQVDTNVLGDRGESIFKLAVTTLHDAQPLFKPAALGEKWPVADFAVELVNRPGRFFLVQVKATQKSINDRVRRLPVDVKVRDVRLLLSSPMPAYLVVVHEPVSKRFLRYLDWCAVSVTSRPHSC